MRRWLGIAALVLAGCATAPLPPAPARIAVGYIPAFEGLDRAIEASPISYYTHLNLAFVNVDPAGRVIAGEKMACMDGGEDGQVSLASLRRAVRSGHDVQAKVLVSLGGGAIPACSGDWAALLRPGTRDTVVRNLIDLVDREGLDGIDVDIEGELLTRIDKAGDFLPFIEALGDALHRRGKLLTTATGSYEGGMVPVESVAWFDLVNVMAYDLVGPTWGEPGAEHSPYEQAERDLALWRSRGVPRDKLVLGVPFYGRGFGSYAGGENSYRQLVRRFGEQAAQGDVIGERCGGCSYITYNGPATIARKAALARELAGGVMVWELTEDSEDAALTRALLGK